MADKKNAPTRLTCTDPHWTLLRPHRGKVRRHIHDLLPSSALAFRLELFRFKKRTWQMFATVIYVREFAASFYTHRGKSLFACGVQRLRALLLVVNEAATILCRRSER